MHAQRPLRVASSFSSALLYGTRSVRVSAYTAAVCASSPRASATTRAPLPAVRSLQKTRIVVKRLRSRRNLRDLRESCSARPQFTVRAYASASNPPPIINRISGRPRPLAPGPESPQPGHPSQRRLRPRFRTGASGRGDRKFRLLSGGGIAGECVCANR